MAIRTGRLSSTTDSQRNDPEVVRRIDYDSLSELYQSKQWLEAIDVINKEQFAIENALRDLLGSEERK